MRKAKITLLLCMFIPAFSWSQVNLSKDFNVSLGTPYKVIDARSKEYFSDGKSNVISIKTDDEKVFLQRFDFKTMKEVSRKEYEDFPPYNKVQDILQLGNKLYYIFSSFNKKEKAETIYAREINMSTGTFETPKALFSTSKEVAVSTFAEGARAGFFGLGMPVRFQVYHSSDNSKFMIRFRLVPEFKSDKKNYDVLGFYVFNSSFEKLWGGEVKMPYTEKEMNNLAYGVNKEGNAFMLAYQNVSKRFELFNIGKDLKVTPNVIDIDGKLIFQKFEMQEMPDGSLNAVGIYANGVDFVVNWTGDATTSFNANGILSVKMDQTGKVIKKSDFEFPLELINQYESKRAKEKNAKREDKGKAGINDLKITNVDYDAKGSVTVVAEQQYMRREMVYTRMEEVSYYADVVMAKFDSEGKLLWMKKLPKTQSKVGGGKGGLGIRYMAGTDAGYIIYVDNKKNAKITMDEVPERHSDGKGGFLSAYKVDNNTGAIEKHLICDVDDIKGVEIYQFNTTRIFDAAEKVFMLEAYIKGKEDTMIKMELTK